MSALQTLRDLRTRGFQFQTDGKALAVLPKESLSDSDRTAIRSHKFELIKLLSDKFGGQDKTAESNQLSSKVLTKWHSRGAHLWLGTTTYNGLDYRTLEYEFDCAISPKWLKELERDKGFIQTALVAQEVRELSARYWAERRAEAQTKAEQIENEPKADSPTEPPTNSPEANQAPLTPQTAPSIDRQPKSYAGRPEQETGRFQSHLRHLSRHQ